MLLSLVLAVVLVGSRAADPLPTPYPLTFSINFDCNVTTDIDSPVVPIKNSMYYDWNIEMQRVDHGAGSYECVEFYNSYEPCSLFFTPDGLYRVLSAPLPEGQEECCLDMDSIHASPPDWAIVSNPTYNGVATDPYSGFEAAMFTFDNFEGSTNEPHKHYEVAPSDETYAGTPLLFTFPVDDGRQDYHYDATTMENRPQDPSLFQLPEGCAMKKCAVDSGEARRRKRNENMKARSGLVGDVKEPTRNFPPARPPVSERTFTSTAIDGLIDQLTPLFRDPDMATVFANCLPNTLDTTVGYFGPAQQWTGLDSFVITGDINALWLRDSANQVIPYAPYLAADDSLKELYMGLINRHAHSVLIDPFANAFNFNNSGEGHQNDQRTPPMSAGVFEGKYEIDSLAAFLKISYWLNYFGALSADEVASVYDETWLNAIEQLLDTVSTMVADDGQSRNPPYLFQRVTEVSTDTLMLSGRGPPAKLNGLTRSLFRPSDDANTLPYNVPGNAMACTELTHLEDLLSTLAQAAEADSVRSGVIVSLQKETSSVRTSLCAALEAVVLGRGERPVPYEVDGYGSEYFMDDANIPSLLSLPVLGYMSTEAKPYVSTRNYVLSKANPYYFEGPAGHGVGGPHEGYNYTWPMAIITAAMTSESDAEVADCLHMLMESARTTGLMHEAFNVNDVNDYTRSWFAWANGLFGELVLQLIVTKPHLVIKNDAEAISLAQSLVKDPVCLVAQSNPLIV